MLLLNYRDSRPIYGQIKDGLRRLIVAGALGRRGEAALRPGPGHGPGHQPQYHPAGLYAELEREGFIYSVPGKGSFAAATGGREDPARRAELIARSSGSSSRSCGTWAWPDREILALMGEGSGQ